MCVGILIQKNLNLTHLTHIRGSRCASSLHEENKRNNETKWPEQHNPPTYQPSLPCNVQLVPHRLGADFKHQCLPCEIDCGDSKLSE